MNDMIYIEKKSVVSIPEVNGAVSDTWNVQNKKTNAPSLDLFKRTIIDKLPTLKKVVLWENSNPSSEFPEQTVNLISSDYDSYEIIWKHQSNDVNNVTFSTGKIPKGSSTQLYEVLSFGTQAFNYLILSRQVTYVSDNQISFAKGARTIDNSGSIEKNYFNTVAIPVKIYGYRNINYEEELAKDSSTYSTEETIVGTWIDGKPIYRKVIDFGVLPNNTTKTYNTGDLNIDTFTEPIRGTSESTTGFCSGIPFVYTANVSYGVSITYNKTTNQISVQTGYDRSAQTKTYIIMEYTKTTD